MFNVKCFLSFVICMRGYGCLPSYTYKKLHAVYQSDGLHVSVW